MRLVHYSTDWFDHFLEIPIRPDNSLLWSMANSCGIFMNESFLKKYRFKKKQRKKGYLNKIATAPIAVTIKIKRL